MSEQSPAIPQMREHIDQLEADLAAERAANATAADAIRENALMRAGVNLDTPLGQLFSDGYKGELETDAIKAAAEAVGALNQSAVVTTEPPPDPEAERVQQERNRLAAETEPAGNLPTGDPIIGAYGAFRSEMEAGRTREEAAPAVLGEIIAQANDGNPAYRYSPEEWRRQQEQQLS